jgi:hypothetical protein
LHVAVDDETEVGMRRWKKSCKKPSRQTQTPLAGRAGERLGPLRFLLGEIIKAVLVADEPLS